MALRWLAVATFALATGCGDAPERAAPATTLPPATLPAAPLPTTTLPAAPAPPATVGAPANPDEARRILEQHGIDPDRLSRDIGEQMRRRFEPQPAR